jgi:hypothetical protein
VLFVGTLLKRIFTSIRQILLNLIPTSEQLYVVLYSGKKLKQNRQKHNNSIDTKGDTGIFCDICLIHIILIIYPMH